MNPLVPIFLIILSLVILIHRIISCLWRKRDSDQDDEDYYSTFMKKEYGETIRETDDPSDLYYYTAKERLFLWYINGRPVKEPQISQYFDDLNIQTVIDSFIKNGYLRIARPSECLSLNTLRDLSTILDDYCIPKSGRKEDVVNRILSIVPMDVIDDLYPQYSCYWTTDIGNALILMSRGLILYYKGIAQFSAFLTLEDMDKLIRKYPYKQPDKLIYDYIIEMKKKK